MRSLGLGAQLIQGARLQLVATILALGSSLVSQLLIARTFGLSGLGEYSAVGAVLSLAMSISASGIPPTASRRVGVELSGGASTAVRRVANSGWLLMAITSAFVAILALLLWDRLADAMQLEDPLPPTILAIAMPFGAMIAYANQIFQATLRTRLAAVVLLVEPATLLGLSVAAYAFLAIRPAEIAIAGDIAAGFVAILALAATGHRPIPSRVEMGELLRDARALVPSAYGRSLLRQTDRFIVSASLGQAALGAYSAAAALATIGMRLIDPLGRLLLPAYGRFASGSSGRLERLRSVHVRLWSAYAIVLMGIPLAAADGIVAQLYGPDAGAAAEPLRILAVGLVPGVVAGVLYVAMIGAGQFREALAVTWLSVAVQLLLLGILPGFLALPGAAAARAAALTAAALGYGLFAVGGGFARRPLNRAIVAWIAAAAFAIAVSFLPLAWPARASLGAAAALLVCVIVLFGPEERTILVRAATFRP